MVGPWDWNARGVAAWLVLALGLTGIVPEPSDAPKEPAGLTESNDHRVVPNLSQSNSPPWYHIDRQNRKAVQEAYRWDYLWKVDAIPPLIQYGFGWKGGDTGACEPGTLPSLTYAAASTTIDFFRAITGVQPVEFDAVLSEKAQAAALLMDANNGLTHSPPSNWRCYTEAGAEAAAASNLSLGTPAIRQALEGYMHDPGPFNVAVGHRRWFLSPGSELMGFGATTDITAVWVVHSNPTPVDTPMWIPWPADGYWPKEMMTGRWSLSTPAFADFSGASVVMTHDGRPVDIELYPVFSGYGYLETIVWDVVDPDFVDMVLDDGDQDFRISVSGIWSDGEIVDHSYTVSAFDAIPPGLTDITTSTFARDAVYLQWHDITRGCNPPSNDRFCPDDPVTRGQMAAFLVRAFEYSDDGGGDLFVDDDDSIFESDIDKLGTAGVTRGCNPPNNDRFCPDDPVTRGQMAAFLVRAFEYSDDGGGDLFVDDDDSIFESDIDKLGTAGVTLGCNPPNNDRFCPDDPVTRGQMAAFLHRALDG